MTNKNHLKRNDSNIFKYKIKYNDAERRIHLRWELLREVIHGVSALILLKQVKKFLQN